METKTHPDDPTSVVGETAASGSGPGDSQSPAASADPNPPGNSGTGLTLEAIAAADALIAQLEAVLSGYPTIPDEDRTRLRFRASDKRDFGPRMLEFSEVYPDRLPRGLELEEFNEVNTKQVRVALQVKKMSNMLARTMDGDTLLGVQRQALAKRAFRVMQAQPSSPEMAEQLRELSHRLRRPVKRKSKPAATAAGSVTPAASAQ